MLLTVAILALGAGCRRGAEPQEMLVFAAASTADALSELGKDFQAEAGAPVRFSFGASRDLARQIRAGAPADVFVSAEAETVDTLVAAGLVDGGDRRTLMSNHLVVIVPAESSRAVRTPRDLANVAHLALGDPTVVPAGAYAKRWLETEGVWEDVQAHVVPALDVRAALAAVAAGHAEAGIVYRTDAKSSRAVRIAYEVPPERAPPIAYVAARLARSTVPASTTFLRFLTGPKARATFARHGFAPPAKERP